MFTASVEVPLETCKTTKPVNWDLQVASQISDFSVEKQMVSLPRFLSFLPWKTCAHSSSSADSLPLTRSYLLPAAETCPVLLPFTSTHLSPSCPSCGKTPALWPRTPSSLGPSRQSRLQGCLWMWGTDRKQYNTDGIGLWSRYSELSSRLLGDTPILTSGLSSKYKALLFLAYPGSQYKVRPRWLISKKRNIGSVIMSYRQHTKCLCSTARSKFVK